MNDPTMAALHISASAIKAELERMPEGTDLEARAHAAFKAARNDGCGWMLYNDDQKFRAGVGGLLLFYKDDDEITARLTHEMRMLQAVSAATHGVPVDFAAMGDPDNWEVIGLMRIYREVD